MARSDTNPFQGYSPIFEKYIPEKAEPNWARKSQDPQNPTTLDFSNNSFQFRIRR